MIRVFVMLFPGSTSLICASIEGHLPVVKYLVELKANIEAKNNIGVIDSSSVQFVCIF